MRPAGAAARIRAVLPAILVAVLSLSGCTHLSPPDLQNPRVLRGCTDVSARRAPARWWRCLGDAQLSILIERTPGPAPAQAPEIAARYIAMRAQQTALVLLAEREERDNQLVAVARRRFADGTAPGRPVAAAEAQLADTRADQAHTRAAIAALRDGLAVLAGAAPGALDRLPGGPIPLPPAAPMLGDPAAMIARRADIHLAKRKLDAVRGAGRDAALADYRAAVVAARQDVESALGRYAAAQVAAAQAQSAALDARAAATLQTMPARTGTVASGDADRRALDALQAEEHTRAAMTQAYVVLARSLGWDGR